MNPTKLSYFLLQVKNATDLSNIIRKDIWPNSNKKIIQRKIFPTSKKKLSKY